MESVLDWLYELQLSVIVRESTWLFPTLEWIHLYSMVTLITLVASFDLRLLGFSISHKPRPPLSKLAGTIWPWTLVSFFVNALTGSLLFASKGPEYATNYAFLVKMGLVALGVAYHALLFYYAGRWEDSRRGINIMASKVIGTFSLLLWIGVIAASRWIAFVVTE